MLKRFLPAAEWLPNYKRDDLSGDLQAGFIVAIMLIPQGMAYAMLAGLPPVVGLYASTIPLIIYALLGTSRQLSVGPVAMVSLLVLAGVSTIAEPGTDEYISLVLLLMLMIGIIQLVMGLCKLGFIVNFISHAVISGFTSAAAIIIGVSQFDHLFGFEFAGSDNVFLRLVETVQRIGDIHLISFFIGAVSILLIILLKKQSPKIPAPLIVVVVMILFVNSLNLHHTGVDIVGNVPAGLPSFSVPELSFELIGTLLPLAVTIALIGFMESIAMAKMIAAKEKYKITPNKELIALGTANIGGSFFSAYPVTGGFSRSAVNYQSGAKTPLASLISAVIIILTLLFFTEWFYFLPNAVLAAIILVAVYNLIDFKEMKHLFSISRIDGAVWLTTFSGTLILGIEEGILLGVAASLLILIVKSSFPYLAELGFSKDSANYKDIRVDPQAEKYPGTVIIRIDASLYFANAPYLEEKFAGMRAELSNVKRVILDFRGVNYIDATALQSLEEIIADYEAADVAVAIANMKETVRKKLNHASWEQKRRQAYDFASIEQALTALETNQ
ncbi:SulP family inorganic anion transporter [Salisediminibacterium halotolerans]|uniref:Sulfate permease, SulP family n=1 Tax=Salisediminibacterium halotolerans TaxID=517425 RepID=A0A1H9VJ97_9BACI|nr:solute carrier family 26 protein [Salisediminibacterium haloalkalitolerans]SES21407.1 sulfate permease, SulP family [Salisediminibacterium haloalkalitolerans]